MSASFPDKTLLTAFLDVARNPQSVERIVVECGNESWSYGELDVVSSGVAMDLEERYGLRPVVSIISENHPYILAVMLAVWKLNGIFAPIDHHAPRNVLERMLEDIKPTVVILPSTDDVTKRIVDDLSIPRLLFDPKVSTITALRQQYIAHSHELPAVSYPGPPLPSDVAVYLHTSSSSSLGSVKCVPLTHANIFVGSYSRRVWWMKTWAHEDFDHIRVLGWSPWSHVIGISHDIGAAVLLSAGCYVFGLTPSTYYRLAKNERDEDYSSVPARLLRTALEKKTTAFAGVPWVLEGFMAEYNNCTQKETLLSALHNFKIIGSGGARTSAKCIEWASELGLPLIFDLGMTEIGGALFHAAINEKPGYALIDCLVPDAELFLVDEAGRLCSDEGELCIKSKFIGRGYLNSKSTAFSVDPDGTVTLRTGDRYEHTSWNRLVWKGRKEDFIQMTSGESIDPQEIENTLNEGKDIARSCVVGNDFQNGPAEFVCAIIECRRDISASPGTASVVASVTKAVAAANRMLAPPLRISWGRVLILDPGECLPLTKKGAIHRQKVEQLFVERMTRLLEQASAPPVVQHVLSDEKTERSNSALFSRDEVESIVMAAVSEALKIDVDILQTNSHSTFAELGMDSAMATMIVNKINSELKLKIPLNTCHTHVDLFALLQAILEETGLKNDTGTQAPNIPSPKPVAVKDEVVIVGQAVRLPGETNTPESLWQALLDRRDDLFSEVPSDRWDHKSFYNPATSKGVEPGDITFEKAGFIDIAHFDNSFFSISSPEAIYIAPAVRLTLELAFEALENANIPISQVRGTDMGVFVAAETDEGYNHLLLFEQGFSAYGRFYGTGVSVSTACGRLSYLLDVHGPSMMINTACSSGMVVVDQAVRYLESGAGESAIVCGVNTHCWPGSFGFVSSQKMTSVRSRSATFTKEADGYGASEGAAAVVLKTRSAAIRDGDRILGVIKATATRHDGRSQGLVAPNVRAQIGLQRVLLANAGLDPTQIDYIETHGTGTTLGDLIETQGINEVFAGSHSTARPLLLGASKTCVGHTELAAGLVGLVAAIAALAHATAPGLVHLTEDNRNAAIDCSRVPMVIPFRPAPLVRAHPSDPLRALVLANGFAGTIAGAIVESPPSDDGLPPHAAYDGPALFVVSAKTEMALAAYIERYVQYCRAAPPSDFRAICYTSVVGREHYRCRFACVAFGMQHLVEQLEHRAAAVSRPPAGRMPHLCFAFPGQGSQFQGMARDLYFGYSGFRAILTDAAQKAANLTCHPILPLLVDEYQGVHSAIDQSEIAQVCLFVYQYAVASWLKTVGVLPYAVLGHSLGEIPASVIAGAMSFEAGLKLVAKRAWLLRAQPDHPAGMAAVAATADVIKRYIDMLRVSDRIALAVFNGPKSHVVSGELGAVEELVDAVKSDALRATKLNVDQGFHSHCIAPAIPAFKAWLQREEESWGTTCIPFFSTLLGIETPEGHRLGSEYWVEHARSPVKFYQAASQVVSKAAVDIIVDVGPQPMIWSNLQTPELSGKMTIATTSKRGKDQGLAFLRALAALFESGVAIQLKDVLTQRSERYPLINLPTYPFQRQRYYPSYIVSRTLKLSVVNGHAVPRKPIVLEKRMHIDQDLCHVLDDHRIEGRKVLPGAALVDFFAQMSPTRSIRSIRFHSPMVVESPNKDVRGKHDPDGSFALFEGALDAFKICSGLMSRDVIRPPRRILSQGECLKTVSSGDIYKCFKLVRFGPSFRSILEVRVWPTHVDGLILVEPSPFPAYDRMRKMDACLHMFGAVATFSDNVVLFDTRGCYLPTSLEEFSLHSHDLPTSFICRYHLPVETDRSGRLISIAFEVLTKAGELLFSCKKYSVAFIPEGVAIQSAVVPASTPPPSKLWSTVFWDEPDEPELDYKTEAHRFSEMLVLGNNRQSWVMDSLIDTALESVFVKITDVLGESEGATSVHATSWLDKHAINKWNKSTKGNDVSIIVDLTTVDDDDAPAGSALHGRLCHGVLMFLKTLMGMKIRISNFVVISSASAPVHTRQDGIMIEETENQPKSTTFSGIGAIVQGMARVFRRETSSPNVWGLDLPPLGGHSDPVLQRLVAAEVRSRFQSGTVSHHWVAYRRRANGAGIVRLVPRMEFVERPIMPSTNPLSGVTVVVGMGSIGSALAPALIAAGSTMIVFIGRRKRNDSSVDDELKSIARHVPGKCHYVQADVCNLDDLRSAFITIQSSFGDAIVNIIHTAAVMNDVAITNIRMDVYDEVARPKILGAWNLHFVSEELKLPLKTFVLLSSVQVVYGNPGQIAYVSGNAYLESLAGYRQRHGLPATALQLGAWESEMIKNVDMTGAVESIIRHEHGVPIIIQAMTAEPAPVQLIVDWNVSRLSASKVHKDDPFFSCVLGVRPDTMYEVPAQPSEQAHRGNGNTAGNMTDEATMRVCHILRAVLELGPSETLDIAEPLTSLGIDSISFAQIRGQALKELDVDLPVMYLSDMYSISDMIEFVSRSMN